MIVIIGDQVRWACDVCHDAAFDEGIVVFGEPSGPRHFPAPRVVCSESCAAIAETLLTVEPVHRMGWDAFVKGLTT